MCLLAWLQELRNRHNLATHWPKLANNKIERGKNKPPILDPSQEEIFLVTEHHNHQ